MGDKTRIAWCDSTFNPWIGCSKVSAGCTNCYAEKDTPARVSRSRGLELWGRDGARRVTADSTWREPLRWNREAADDNTGRRVFCASQCDIFEDLPQLAAPRARLAGLIARTLNLTWLLLTKRPQNAHRLLVAACAASDDHGHCICGEHVREGSGPPEAETMPGLWCSNIWLGTSVENDEAARVRIPHLVRTPVTARFLSVEPLLGPLDLTHIDGDAADVDGVYQFDALTGRNRDMGRPCEDLPRVDWVVVGGESGTSARPCDVRWVRDIVKACRAASVPVFAKQLGSNPVPIKPMRTPSFNAFTGRPYKGWLEDGPAAISDPKGGEMSEWPPDVRVREFPRECPACGYRGVLVECPTCATQCDASVYTREIGR